MVSIVWYLLFCHTLLPYTAVMHCCHTLLPYTAAIFCCHALLPYTAATHCCHILLSYIAATHCCHILLPSTATSSTAIHFCPTVPENLPHCNTEQWAVLLISGSASNYLRYERRLQIKLIDCAIDSRDGGSDVAGIIALASIAPWRDKAIYERICCSLNCSLERQGDNCENLGYLLLRNIYKTGQYTNYHYYYYLYLYDRVHGKMGIKMFNKLINNILPQMGSKIYFTNSRSNPTSSHILLKTGSHCLAMETTNCWRQTWTHSTNQTQSKPR